MCNKHIGFAKKRVQWLIEHSTSYQHLWFIDSLVPLFAVGRRRFMRCPWLTLRPNSPKMRCKIKRRMQRSPALPETVPVSSPYHPHRFSMMEKTIPALLLKMAANPKCRLMGMGEAISTDYQNDDDRAAFSS